MGKEVGGWGKGGGNNLVEVVEVGELWGWGRMGWGREEGKELFVGVDWLKGVRRCKKG